MATLWLARFRERPLATACVGALAILFTFAAAWLWAHEGHASLPTEGIAIDAARGLVRVSPEAVAALDVKTAQVVASDLGEPIRATFSVESPWGRRVFASSRLGGRITSLLVLPGQTVTAQQPLAEIQSLDLRDLELAAAQARTEEELAAKNLASLEAAAKRGAVSEQQLLDARFKKQEAANALLIARRRLEGLGVPDAPDDETTSARATPRMVVLRSPIAGVVAHVDVHVGQAIAPEQHVIEIVDPLATEIKLQIQMQDLASVAPGDVVALRPNASGIVLPIPHGLVVSGGLALDPQTGLAAVWPRLTSPEATLQLGTNGTATIERKAQQATLAVPLSAVVALGAERFVFVEEGPGQYARKNIVIGWQQGDVAHVVNDQIVSGDHVVTKGSQELSLYFTAEELRLSPEAEKSIGLRMETVEARSIAGRIECNGTLELPPEQRALASAALSGTLQRLHVRRDQAVQAGDLLADVASLELQQLQLDLLRSHLQLQMAEQSLARLQTLADAGNGGGSLRDFRDIQNSRNMLRQKRDSLQHKLVTVGLTESQLRQVLDQQRVVETLPVRAPISGKVVRFLGNVGQSVKADNPVFEIQDLSRLWVRGFVTERDAVHVRPGHPLRVRLDARPGKVVDTITKVVAPEVDRETRTLSFWADWPTDAKDGLLDATPVRLTLVLSVTAVPMALPVHALSRDGRREFVFTRKNDGVFERRRVETGRRDDRFVEIRSGLNAGERVAVEGVAGLQDAWAALQ